VCLREDHGNILKFNASNAHNAVCGNNRFEEKAPFDTSEIYRNYYLLLFTVCIADTRKKSCFHLLSTWDVNNNFLKFKCLPPTHLQHVNHWTHQFSKKILLQDENSAAETLMGCRRLVVWRKLTFNINEIFFQSEKGDFFTKQNEILFSYHPECSFVVN
jgi:hypothetical protein